MLGKNKVISLNRVSTLLIDDREDDIDQEGDDKPQIKKIKKLTWGWYSKIWLMTLVRSINGGGLTIWGSRGWRRSRWRRARACAPSLRNARPCRPRACWDRRPCLILWWRAPWLRPGPTRRCRRGRAERRTSSGWSSPGPGGPAPPKLVPVAAYCPDDATARQIQHRVMVWVLSNV